MFGGGGRWEWGAECYFWLIWRPKNLHLLVPTLCWGWVLIFSQFSSVFFWWRMKIYPSLWSAADNKLVNFPPMKYNSSSGHTTKNWCQDTCLLYSVSVNHITDWQKHTWRYFTTSNTLASLEWTEYCVFLFIRQIVFVYVTVLSSLPQSLYSGCWSWSSGFLWILFRRKFRRLQKELGLVILRS